jgi:hypothetical protein
VSNGDVGGNCVCMSASGLYERAAFIVQAQTA